MPALMCAMAIAAAALATGCVTRRPIIGRDLARDQVQAIVPGETTREQILARFGTPDSALHYPDGSEEYRYSYTGWIDRRVDFLVYARTTTDKEHKNLSVRIRDGVVTAVTYRNTASPGDNFSK